MLPELGNFALILALCLALIQSFSPTLSRRAAVGQFAFLLIAFAILELCFITNDFSVLYVAENSNRHLPLFYRITAVWGAHEGSLLLWVSILGLWTTAVAIFSKNLPETFRARVLGIMGLISVGFLLFLLSTSNPFQRLLSNVPTDGQDLNALLQDPGLAFHPPTLYMGYVGLSVAFAFAIAALIQGKLETTWARWTRPWTLIAWCFLTLGITAGSWWSYRELGWGGWWFWDPVENASFMPWLVSTALLHSLAVSEKRNTFHGWTIFLAIAAFSLSLLGTFLVRSGILTSVHAFAMDPTRGAFMLKFLFVVVGSSLLLYAWRGPAISQQNPREFYFFSRESFLLLNNVLLLVAMSCILLGTLYPLLLDALSLEKISVGPPYFNTLFVPLAMILLFCMGIGPLCYWQQINHKLLRQRLIHSMMISSVIGLVFPLLITHDTPWYVLLTLTLATWAIMAMVQYTWQHRQHLTRNRYGMLSAHIGVAVCAIGIALSHAYSLERNVRMAPGDIATVGQYAFQLLTVNQIQGPNYIAAEGEFLITHHRMPVTYLHAQNRIYTVQQIAMTEAAIDASLFRDLYVALAEPLPNNAWAVRIYVKPFIRFIWAGGVLIFLGGLLAASDRRYYQ